MLIERAAMDMDGGIFVNGSGVVGPKLSPAASALTDEDIRRYKRDGFIIIRNAIQPEHFRALNAMFSHIQDHPNLLTKIMDSMSCQSFVFGSDRVVPEFALLMYRLNLHWVAQRCWKRRRYSS